MTARLEISRAVKLAFTFFLEDKPKETLAACLGIATSDIAAQYGEELLAEIMATILWAFKRLDTKAEPQRRGPLHVSRN